MDDERCIFFAAQHICADALGKYLGQALGASSWGLAAASITPSLSPLLAPMLSSPAMRAVCDDVAYLQHMLDFEAALARAEAAVGVIPARAAGPIATAGKAEGVG